MTFFTIRQIKEANKSAGMHWFEPATLRFFGSRIHKRVYYGKFFITSERCRWEGGDNRRLYSIRQANEDGSIDTVGEFQAYATKAQAVSAMHHFAKEEQS